MKSNRTFVRKGKKLEIKEIVDDMPTLDNGRLIIASKEHEGYQIFMDDLRSIIDRRTCSFIRPYIPGEFEGFILPDGLDLSEITHTFVLMGDPDEHVQEHLKPLGTTFKAVVFTVDQGMPTLARVPLLPEQAEVLKQNGEQD